jgi:hypothetical protein
LDLLLGGEEISDARHPQFAEECAFTHDLVTPAALDTCRLFQVCRILGVQPDEQPPLLDVTLHGAYALLFGR